MPEDPTVLYHLGLAYFKNDEKDSAITMLEKALGLEKEFQEKGEAEALLAEIRTGK